MYKSKKKKIRIKYNTLCLGIKANEERKISQRKKYLYPSASYKIHLTSFSLSSLPLIPPPVPSPFLCHLLVLSVSEILSSHSYRLALLLFGWHARNNYQKNV